MRGVLSILVLAMLAGCFAPEEPEQGSVSIYVTDAATDEFDEIHVVFHDVMVHGAGNGTGWITVFQNETGLDIDLLNLTGARSAFLGEANLTAGKYTQIRINASEAYGIQNGERVEITLANSKLKVVKSFNITAGSETRIVLDFDLDRSVHKQGPHGWKMTPVIGKTFVETVAGDESGADVHDEGEVAEIDGVA